MAAYLANGARLGWLLLPHVQVVEIWPHLQLAEIWAGNRLLPWRWCLDCLRLRPIYNGADAKGILSRQDNLPNTVGDQLGAAARS
jgi:hypothetical protein